MKIRNERVKDVFPSFVSFNNTHLHEVFLDQQTRSPTLKVSQHIGHVWEQSIILLDLLFANGAGEVKVLFSSLLNEETDLLPA